MDFDLGVSFLIIKDQQVIVKWNGANRKHYEQRGYTFTNSGEAFKVNNISDLSIGSVVMVQCICDYCGKKFSRKYNAAIKKQTHFCTDICGNRFVGKQRSNKGIVYKQCAFCNKKYKIKKSLFESSRFCSRKCKGDYESENKSGANNPNYVKRYTISCGWCGKTLKRTAAYLKSRNMNFCNKDCRNNWHSEVYVKQQDVINRNRKILLSNLTNGKISFTESKPQVIIDKLLNTKEIKFEKEKVLGKWSVDLFLTNYNLLIEINGGFWHADNRYYKNINYDIQLKRIKYDKRKNTYLRNKKYYVLYLWEDDIYNNIRLCEKLIDDFINNKGKLMNYHSFNYSLKKDELTLKNEIIRPYIEWSIEELSKITDTTTRSKANNYQPEKHIKFNCLNCNKEKIRYKHYYDKFNKLFCSLNCSKEYRQKQKRILFCANCNKEIVVNKYKADLVENRIQKNIFCSTKCKQNYSKKAITFNCDYCKKRCETIPSLYKRSRNHFCSHLCFAAFQKLSSNMTKNCNCCNKEFSVKKVSHNKDSVV